MTESHGGAAVVEVLKAFGVTHFFNVPGESFLPILDAIGSEKSIQLITNRVEAGASFGADGFAKVAGFPAVCMATRAPGACNLSIGVQTAYYDSTPMLALLGLIPSRLQGSAAFQEFDPLSMFASIAKRTLVVSARSSLPAIIAQGLQEATTGRPGPVVVGIPTDYLDAMGPQGPVATAQAENANPSDVHSLGELILGASRPALLMETEAVRGPCANSVAIIAGHLGIPVFCGWRHFSAFDNGNPCFAGSLGLGAERSVAARLMDADLVVSIGRLEQITVEAGGLNRAGLTLVSIAPVVEPSLGRHVTNARVVQIAAQPEPFADLLAQYLSSKDVARRPPLTGRRSRHALDPELDTDPAMARLNERLPGDAIVVSDAGDFARSLLRVFSFDRSRSYIGPVSGAMGYGLPAAIGAQLAAPSRPVVCVAGDGGLLMTAGEMETATRLGLQLTVVVFNNRAYGTIKSRQAENFPGREVGTSLGPVRFSELAKSMGWGGWSVANVSELDDALGEAVAAPVSRLIEVQL